MIDLHLHSLYSDGDYSLSNLIREAHRNNINTISLTDHDCILGLEEAKLETKKYDMQFINGVELEAYTNIANGEYIHILAYNFKETRYLKEYLDNLRKERLLLINQYIDLLNSLGIDIDFEKVNALSPGRHLTVSHIAVYLVKNGFCNNFEEAKQKYLLPDSKYYIERNYYSPKYIIDLILKSGGIPVLAHPCRLKFNDAELDSFIHYLKNLGLKGIEAYYSTNTVEQTQKYLSIAKKYNLIVTAGSDWHSPSENIEMGFDFETDLEKEILFNLNI